MPDYVQPLFMSSPTHFVPSTNKKPESFLIQSLQLARKHTQMSQLSLSIHSLSIIFFLEFLTPSTSV